MEATTFMLLWITLSFPIVHIVNKRMEAKADEHRFKTRFQIFLFIRAQLEVPRFYITALINLVNHKRN